MRKTGSSLNSSAITRREAIRRAVVFSTGAWMAGRLPGARAAAPRTTFGDDGLHVLALGDFGAGNDAQLAVAQQMATFAKSLDRPLEAVLALGDNFYNKLTPDRFDAHFERMYAVEHLNCPFYVVAGNHDYGTASYDFQQGKLQMQLDYAKANAGSRWRFPSKWYAVELPDSANPLVKFIVLDGSYWEGALTPQEKIAQRRFLKSELEKPSRAPWLWMVNHYPLFSESADRGDNATLIREWGPHLQQHPVALLLAGHDHTLQHLHVEGYSTSFVVSGAGGARLYDIQAPHRGFADNRHYGFVHIHATTDYLQLQFIAATGECLHAFRRDRAGNVEVRPLA
ncbi:MAG: metallophosphoesterase [Planctomycetota bacterium]|nr:MAG: metallophosphoesterase [Planctomycetota bacterium]